MFLLQSEQLETLDALALKLGGAAAAAAVDAPRAVEPSRSVARGAGFLVQLRWLAVREKDLLLRDKAGLIAMVLAPALLNLLFALIFYQAGDQSRPDYEMTTHFGAITQIAIGGMFGAAQPLLLKFPLEAALFRREYATKTYSATAYFLSKTVRSG